MGAMTQKTSTKRWILAICALVLIAVIAVGRLYLTTWILVYVNNVLAHIDGYQGSVESINLDLFRGAYSANHLVINKKDGRIPTPFVAIDHVDLSIQWKALLHGRIVSSATISHPVINFAVNKSESQTGQNVDWTKPIKELTPIDINHVWLRDGSITYQDFSSTPQVNIFIHHMNGEVSNLRNIVETGNALPSRLNIEGSSIGNGKLKISGRMNILKDTPDMNMLVALDHVDLPAMNNYSEAYAAFDFKSGDFSLYSQVITQDGAVSGYVKPIITHLSVNVIQKENPLEIAWSTVVAAVLQIFTNPSKDQFATKIELEGNVKNVGTNTWSALGGIVRNAFISAMSKGFEQTGTPQGNKAE